MNSSGVALTSSSRARLWVRIVFTFVAASMIQVVFYGAPALLRFGSYHVAGPLYIPVVLTLFVAPALAAMLFSLRGAILLYRRLEMTVPVLAVAVIVVLAFVSAYIGVFVSFNTWGT